MLQALALPAARLVTYSSVRSVRQISYSELAIVGNMAVAYGRGPFVAVELTTTSRPVFRHEDYYRAVLSRSPSRARGVPHVPVPLGDPNTRTVSYPATPCFSHPIFSLPYISYGNTVSCSSVMLRIRVARYNDGEIRCTYP